MNGFEQRFIEYRETVAKIWFQVKLYVRVEWNKLMLARNVSRITLAKARRQFVTDLTSVQYRPFPVHHILGAFLRFPLFPPTVQ